MSSIIRLKRKGGSTLIVDTKELEYLGIDNSQVISQWNVKNYDIGSIVFYDSNIYVNTTGKNTGSPDTNTTDWEFVSGAAIIDDVEALETNSLNKQGTVTSDEDQNAGDNKLTDLADGIDDGDAVNRKQLNEATVIANYNATCTGNVITITTDPVISFDDMKDNLELVFNLEITDKNSFNGTLGGAVGVNNILIKINGIDKQCYNENGKAYDNDVGVDGLYTENAFVDGTGSKWGKKSRIRALIRKDLDGVILSIETADSGWISFEPLITTSSKNSWIRKTATITNINIDITPDANYMTETEWFDIPINYTINNIDQPESLNEKLYGNNNLLHFILKEPFDGTQKLSTFQNTQQVQIGERINGITNQ